MNIMSTVFPLPNLRLWCNGRNCIGRSNGMKTSFRDVLWWENLEDTKRRRLNPWFLTFATRGWSWMRTSRAFTECPPSNLMNRSVATPIGSRLTLRLFLLIKRLQTWSRKLRLQVWAWIVPPSFFVPLTSQNSSLPKDSKKVYITNRKNLAGRPSGESQSSFKKWLDRRSSRLRRSGRRAGARS